MELKNSIVLKQTFILIIMSIFFASSIMMIWLTFLTSHFRNTNTIEKTKEKARKISKALNSYHTNNLSADALENILQSSPELIDGCVYISINRQVSWPTYYRPANSKFWDKLTEEKLQNATSTYHSDISNGSEVVFSITHKYENTTNNLLLVGVPLSLNDNLNFSPFVGAIYVIKNLSEQELDITPMLLAFVAALCLTLGMMIFPALYVIKLIVTLSSRLEILPKV